MGKIDFVISVRDRDNKRIQRCIDSLNHQVVNKIYVIDYGSKKEVKVTGAELIRIDKRMVWNKSHALNIGIKKSDSLNYIATIDCDIILSKDFLDNVQSIVLRNDKSFILTRYVRRIGKFFLSDDSTEFEDLLNDSRPWITGVGRLDHQANGGIQIFPSWWIRRVNGYDENLIYWGGMDNDIYERAVRSGLQIVDINSPILHQEHDKNKEENLDKIERQNALAMRMGRRSYLELKDREGMIAGPDRWGAAKPNCKQINTINAIMDEQRVAMQSLKKIINKNPNIKPTMEELGEQLRKDLHIQK